MENLNVDNLISRILNVGEKRLTTNVPQSELQQLCASVKNVFESQPVFIEIDGPVVVCGDIHGQFSDLLRIFSKNGFPSETNYMFLGDYVDRGKQSIEVISLLFAYKVKYPENVFLLRGNHECSEINRRHGFYDEIERRYKNIELWQSFQTAFQWMPPIGCIGMHGGISSHLNSLDQLRQIKRPFPESLDSLNEDILWADPDKDSLGVGFKPSFRNVSFTFGTDVVEEMCRKLDIDLIARAHEVIQEGYKFCANRKCVTIFSAPHYCGSVNNFGATMLVTKDLRISFSIFRPRFQSAKSEIVSTNL